MKERETLAYPRELLEEMLAIVKHAESLNDEQLEDLEDEFSFLDEAIEEDLGGILDRVDSLGWQLPNFKMKKANYS